MIAITEDEYQKLKEDAARYQYIRGSYQWRRYDKDRYDTDEEKAKGHSFIGCIFDYDDNFASVGMLDWHIDKKIKAGKT